MNTLKKGILLSIMMIAIVTVNAQTTVEGTVTDGNNGHALPFANIMIMKGTQVIDGTTSDTNGYFIAIVPDSCNMISIRYLGYDHKQIKIKHTSEKYKLGIILLDRANTLLDEVNILSSVARERNTPVAISTIRSIQIERELGDQPFPEVMKMVPGIYATRYGGGSGDARLSIRGFKQENVALLLNGIPISSVENGLVYWNNWLGLTDATQFIQVQKGLGASRVAMNSVGGSINIITRTSGSKKGGSVAYSVSGYGNQKFTLSLSTGKLSNGIAISFMGTRTQGPGYVDATYVDAWSYFLTLSKEFNSKHSISFTLLGAPERHGQRNFKLSQEEVDLHGLQYNKDWGSYDGEINNLSENFYHKPHMSLNHYWQINPKAFLATSVYLSFGYGGGKWSETYQPNPFNPTNPRIAEIRNPGGQINWNLVYNMNYYNRDTAYLDNGDTVTGFSKNVQTHFLASHSWYGALSTLNYEFNNNVNLTAGVHVRHFKSHLYEKIIDLLGGKYFIEDYAWSLAGVAGRDQIKTVGDIIKVDNNAIINYGSIFTQLEYTAGLLTAFIGGTYSESWYQREDRYNYLDMMDSDIINRGGWDVKAGINYNINEFNHLYLNAGYYSRAPYFKFVFGSYTNVTSLDLKNEKLRAIELGYGLNTGITTISLNAYMTYWEDKNFLSNEYIQLQNNDQTRAFVSGLDASHMGIECELSQKITKNITAGIIASIGDWQWKNDVTAILYNDNNVDVDTVNVYADGLYVGDAPQTQLGVYSNFRIFRHFNFSANFLYYDRLYADFDPSTRNNPDDRNQPYRIPSYAVLDLHLGYGFRVFGKSAYGNISCFNALNRDYIVRGEDGTNHDLDSFRGFWSFPRVFSFSLKVSI